MDDLIDDLLAQARSYAPEVQNRPQLEAFKARFVGPHGQLTVLMKGMGKLPAAEKPAAGKAINAAKIQLEAIFDNLLSLISEAEMAAKLGPAIDPTLPGVEGHKGGRHPLSIIRERVYAIFRQLGFSVADGTHVESEWACFDALNVPPQHPSRAVSDTYYFGSQARFTTCTKKTDERFLLRTHTSSVQIRTMLEEKPPLKIVTGGRCFRRDTADATHSANFHQIEALCVDESISVQDLKATIDFFLKSLFGESVKIRLRPSFFPFTEPSFEVDILSPNLGKLSNRWIEILGCGRVNPKVFEKVGLDPKKWSGFAMGIGIERIAMIVYGIDDIRHFYQNDLQFLLSLT